MKTENKTNELSDFLLKILLTNLEHRIFDCERYIKSQNNDFQSRMSNMETSLREKYKRESHIQKELSNYRVSLQRDIDNSVKDLSQLKMAFNFAINGQVISHDGDDSISLTDFFNYSKIGEIHLSNRGWNINLGRFDISLANPSPSIEREFKLRKLGI